MWWCLSLRADLYLPSRHTELNILLACETILCHSHALQILWLQIENTSVNSDAIPSVHGVFWAVAIMANEMIFDSSCFPACAELYI